LAFQSNKDYDGLPQVLHPNAEVRGEVHLNGIGRPKNESPGAGASGLQWRELANQVENFEQTPWAAKSSECAAGQQQP
jgi:hypothetical protein